MYHPNNDPTKFSLGAGNRGNNSVSSGPGGSMKVDMHGFTNDSLLLGQTSGFVSGSPNLNILATPGERIPSIASMTSGGGNYSHYGNSINGGRGIKHSSEIRNIGSDNKEFSLYGRTSLDNDMIQYNENGERHPTINDAGYPSYHTLGQMADQFQERARADRKHAVEQYGEDYADEEDEDDNDHALIPQGNESTGRWTRQEHELFLEALKKYGKEWKKVASMVKTRTVVQTRTHAQKYFQKVTKSIGGAHGYSDDEAPMDMGSGGGSGRKSGYVKKGRRPHDMKDASPMYSSYMDPEDNIKLNYGHYGGTPSLGAPGSILQRNDYSSSGNFSIDENSLDRDSMVLSELHMTPAVPTFKNSLINPNSISNDNMSSDNLQGFPQPSPAACGKRKHAELAAAQMLASSGTFEMEGAQVLTMLKDDTGRKRPAALTLSILNPDLSSSSDKYDNVPSTPWESDLRTLESRSSQAKPSSTTSNQSGSVPVSTPSEQKNFIAKVRLHVQSGDIEGLREVLEAAEYSAQSYVNSSGKNNTGSTNLISQFSTPGAESRVVEGNDSQVPASASKRTPAQSLVARSLNRSDKREKSVVMDAVCLDSSVYNQQFIVDMCNVLNEYGAFAGLTDANNFTALHYAAEKGLELVGRALLVKGCPINIQNADGDAATHIAARHGHAPFLDLLADFGANFHLRNNQASCALDLAGSQSKDPGERAVIRRLMLSKESRLRTLILYHDDCLEHSARKSSDWEGPDRLLAIMKRLRDRREFPEYELEISNQFEKASVVLLSRAHSPEYLSFVNKLSNKLNSDGDGRSTKEIPAPPVPFTPQVQRFVKNQTAEELKRDESCDTSFSVGTLTAARRAAGAVAHAVDCVLLGRNRNVFCVVRPPGHHAGYSGLLDGGYSCGFCIFNSVAAGALHALEEHNCDRVAIIDLDVHHGNGTEDIVRRYTQPSRLFFFSLHLYDKELSPEKQSVVYQFYPGSGDSDDNIHNIINVPLVPLWKDEDSSKGPESKGRSTASSSPVSTTSSSVKNEKLSIESKFPSGSKTVNAATLFGREAYRQAILQRLIPSLRAFNPDLILMSSGFDAAAGDVGNCRNFPGRCERGMDLSAEDFEWATSEVMKIADLCCSGKLVSVLEGGYGEYERPTSKGHSRAPSARLVSKHGNSVPSESNAESIMNRDILAKSAVAHVHRLIDPYGPPRSNDTLDYTRR